MLTTILSTSFHIFVLTCLSVKSHIIVQETSPSSLGLIPTIVTTILTFCGWNSLMWVKSMPRCLREIHALLFVKILFYIWQDGSLFVKSRCWEWSPCCGFPLHFDRLSDNTSLGPKIYWLIIIWAISPWNLASWDDLRSIFRHSKSYEVGEISNGISYQILMDSC